jgi:hypothetical protein
MTKRLIITSVVCLLGALQMAFTQDGFQLENAGFEAWDSDVKPANWNTYGTVQCSGLYCSAQNDNQCRKSTDVRGGTGNYCVVAVAAKVFGIVANGIVTSGVINAGAMSATDEKIIMNQILRMIVKVWHLLDVRILQLHG